MESERASECRLAAQQLQLQAAEHDTCQREVALEMAANGIGDEVNRPESNLVPPQLKEQQPSNKDTMNASGGGKWSKFLSTEE